MSNPLSLWREHSKSSQLLRRQYHIYERRIKHAFFLSFDLTEQWSNILLDWRNVCKILFYTAFTNWNNFTCDLSRCIWSYFSGFDYVSCENHDLLTAPFSYLLFVQWKRKGIVQHRDDIKHHRVKKDENSFSHMIDLHESFEIKHLRRFFFRCY